MRGAIGKKVERVELNMTSAIDVVFLLVIFFLTFMATLDWPKDEGNIAAFLPRKEEGASASPKEEKNQVEIALRPGPGGEGVVVLFNGNDVNGFSGLRSALRLLKTSAPDSQVLLACERSVRYHYVIRTLDVCAEYGFKDVAFAVAKKEP